MSLVGIKTTVSVHEAGGNLVLTIPARIVRDLALSKGNNMILRVVGKDLRYRRVDT